MKHLIAPSILSADFTDLEKSIELIEGSEADMYHVDVMDGMFVPNISFGFPIMDALKKNATKPLDTHLMIVQPERYIERFAEAGASIITVHYEACTHLDRVVNQIKQTGARAGVAINPHTSVSLLENVITELDLVLVMSVNPGFGGQSFILNTYNKIHQLVALCEKQNTDVIIEVDGGVNLDNIPLLLAAGANAFVAGNAIFAAENPRDEISKMKSAQCNTREI